MLHIDKNLVSCDWLKENLDNSNLVVLDASQISKGDSTTRTVILGSIHFDFSNIICDLSSGLPNTMPSEDKFTQEVSKFGIKMTDTIVVYDEKGIYSSPRVWWMFKAMGFTNVAVLNGGLPTWVGLGYPTDQSVQVQAKSFFETNYQSNMICDKQKIIQLIKDPSSLLLDARSNSRFTGVEAETRKGLRSGHIPSSINLHFRTLVPEYKMLARSELLEIFEKIIPDFNEPIVFTCGSGVTACILALAATICGYKDLCVYDGSWAEWGADESLPIGRS